MQFNVQDALARRTIASSSLIPSFQQTLLSRGEPPSMPRDMMVESAVSSGGSSPLSRPRHDTTTTTGSLSMSTVAVPIVNSSALGDRDFRKASRADSTDSTTSTLPGELLLYEPASSRVSGKSSLFNLYFYITLCDCIRCAAFAHSARLRERVRGQGFPQPCRVGQQPPEFAAEYQRRQQHQQRVGPSTQRLQRR